MIFLLSIVEICSARGKSHLLFYRFQPSQKGEKQIGRTDETGCWVEVNTNEV